MNVEEMKIEELAWDSDFFGYKVGKLDLQDIENTNKSIDEINLDDFKLIYIFVSPNSELLKNQLSNIGAKFLDRKTEYKLDLSEIEIHELQNKNLNFHFLNLENLNSDLYNLSYEAGKNSRFKLDENFKKNEFRNLYDIWLKKSIDKEIAFESIGVYLNEKLLGFITLGNKYDGANIGLIAVDENYQNQGIGHELLNFTFKYLKDKKTNFVYVTTQGLSKQATSFYEKNGFKLLNQVDIYHLWKN